MTLVLLAEVSPSSAAAAGEATAGAGATAGGGLDPLVGRGGRWAGVGGAGTGGVGVGAARREARRGCLLEVLVGSSAGCWVRCFFGEVAVDAG